MFDPHIDEALERADWIIDEDKDMNGPQNPKIPDENDFEVSLAEHEMKTIRLDPNWEATALWFAFALREHSFERNAREPIRSFIEQIRYLTQTDPEAVERILVKLG